MDGLSEEDRVCIAASVAIAPALTSEQIEILRSVFAPDRDHGQKKPGR